MNPNAIADYAGQVIATAVLGSGNPGIPGLSSTVSMAVAGLFSAIGADVATQAGNAVVTLLTQTGVPTTLATIIVNGFAKGFGQPLTVDASNSRCARSGSRDDGFRIRVRCCLLLPFRPGGHVHHTQLIAGLAGDSAVQAEVALRVGDLVASASVVGRWGRR